MEDLNEATKEYIQAAREKNLHKLMDLLRNNKSEIDMPKALKVAPEIFDMDFYITQDEIEETKKIVLINAELNEWMKEVYETLEYINKQIQMKFKHKIS